MEKSSAERRIAELSRELELHNHRYYVLARPSITDREFDAMLKELEALEQEFPDLASPNSPTQRVGGDITKGFPTVPHRYPMLSLGNTYSREEVEEFVGRVEKAIGPTRFSMELKYDGVAISLSYRNGELVRGVTRGDGEKGEDITANVRSIRSIPLRLQGDGWPAEFEARGEVILTKQQFDKLNAKRHAGRRGALRESAQYRCRHAESSRTRRRWPSVGSIASCTACRAKRSPPAATSTT